MNRTRLAALAAGLSTLALATTAVAQAPTQPYGAQPQPYGAQPQPYGAQPQPYGAQPAAGAPGQPPPSGYDPNMTAGGLAPPAPLESSSASGDPTIEDDLDASREEDSGRGLTWIWLEAQGGYEHVGLKTFNVDEQALTAGFVDTTANGGFVSAGLGARLVFLTLGVRGRMGFFEAWQLGRIGGELGFRIPLGPLEPRFDLGFGYAGLGSFDGIETETIAIDGFYARAGAGLDVYVADAVSIGGAATFDFMALTRPGLSPTDIADLQSSGNATDAQASLLAAEGSGYGSTVGLMGTLGLHF